MRWRDYYVKTFLAIKIPEKTQIELLAWQEKLRKYLSEDVFYFPNWDSLHITLMYLDETEEYLIPALVDEILESCSNVNEFSLLFRGLGTFLDTKSGFPRVYLAKVYDTSNIGQVLYRDLRRRMWGLNFKVYKNTFVPHVTLAKAKNAKVDVSKGGTIQKASDFTMKTSGIKVKNIYLLESIPHETKSIYKEIQKFKLGQ